MAGSTIAAGGSAAGAGAARAKAGAAALGWFRMLQDAAKTALTCRGNLSRPVSLNPVLVDVPTPVQESGGGEHWR
jgi:hypothetical protein